MFFYGFLFSHNSNNSFSQHAMLTLTLTITIVLIALYFAFQGRKVTIPARDYTLNGRLYGKAEKMKHDSAILFISGRMPTRYRMTTSSFYAGFISRKPHTICLTVALRGMGSEGDINTLSRADYLEDVIAAYDYLANTTGVDKANIRVVGESFGGYLACLLTTRRPVRKMALRVPTDFSNEGFTDIPYFKYTGNSSNQWKSKKHAFCESFALKAINDFKGSLMMVTSERDLHVPIQTTQNYLAAVRDSTKLEYLHMKRATHGMLHPKLQWEYIQKLSKWLRL